MYPFYQNNLIFVGLKAQRKKIKVVIRLSRNLKESTTKGGDKATKEILDRLPTKDNLNKRNAIGEEQSLLCPFFQFEDETCSHILFTCPKVDRIWKLCYNWLSLSTVCPSNVISHIWQHDHFAGSRRQRKNGMRSGVQLYGAFGKKGMNVFLMRGHLLSRKW